MCRYPACHDEQASRIKARVQAARTQSKLVSKTNSEQHADVVKLGAETAWGGREDLDGGGDQVADDAGAGLVGAEPHRGDAGAGVEREIGGHLLPRFPLRRREPETDGEG